MGFFRVGMSRVFDRLGLFAYSLVMCEAGRPSLVHGEFTPCQFEHHVRPKFATPILHVINNSKNYEMFSTYT